MLISAMITDLFFMFSFYFDDLSLLCCWCYSCCCLYFFLILFQILLILLFLCRGKFLFAFVVAVDGVDIVSFG